VKRVLSVILVLMHVSAIAGQTLPDSVETKIEDRKYLAGTYDEGYYLGKQSASEHYSSGGWVAAGLGSGFLLGLIGAGIIVGVSQSGKVEPPASVQINILDKADEFKWGFHEGYTKQAKKKRLSGSIIGGLLGTAIVVALLTSTSNTN